MICVFEEAKCTISIKMGRSRNKVSVGEPADGSLKKNENKNNIILKGKIIQNNI